MNIKDLRWFPPIVLPKFPNLQGGETILATRFIRKNPLKLDKITYNIPLHNGPTAREGLPNKLKKNWDYLSGSKMDAMGLTKDILYIIEFKSLPNYSISGQLNFYKRKFAEKYSYTNRIELVCVSPLMQFQYFEQLQNEGIIIIEYSIPDIILSEVFNNPLDIDPQEKI